MQYFLILAQTTDSDSWWNSLFLFLFLGFAIAALIWLILWLLSFGEYGDESGTVEEGESSSASSAAESSAAAAKAAKAKADADAAAEAKAKADAEAKAAASAKVEGDDLSKLGLSAGTVAAFNAKGIHKYEDIADWTAGDIAANSALYSSDDPDVDYNQLPWKANALAGGIDLNSVDESDPAFGAPHTAPETVDHDAVIAAEFAGEDVSNDADLGIVYAKGADAAHVDDLTEIKGVGPVISKKLNGYGVFCFKQMAAWSDHNVSEFSERLSCFKNRIERDRWLPQAAALDCEGEDVDEFVAASAEEAASIFEDELASGAVKQDPVYGILYTAKPDDVDDLKKIKGVGKVLEGKLNSIGVYRFKQVAVWTDEACKEFSNMLTAFKDRLYRDNWLAQAKVFHEKKYNEKL